MRPFLLIVIGAPASGAMDSEANTFYQTQSRRGRRSYELIELDFSPHSD
jgi:hypothetical protein